TYSRRDGIDYSSKNISVSNLCYTSTNIVKRSIKSLQKIGKSTDERSQIVLFLATNPVIKKVILATQLLCVVSLFHSLPKLKNQVRSLFHKEGQKCLQAATKLFFQIGKCISIFANF